MEIVRCRVFFEFILIFADRVLYCEHAKAVFDFSNFLFIVTGHLCMDFDQLMPFLKFFDVYFIAYK